MYKYLFIKNQSDTLYVVIEIGKLLSNCKPQRHCLKNKTRMGYTTNLYRSKKFVWTYTNRLLHNLDLMPLK